MIKSIKKRKGIAIPEYVLIGALIAMPIGMAIYHFAPDLIRSYFAKSVDPSANSDSATLKMGIMGE